MQPAVALITTPSRGTAFAIDSQTALTAWHCARDPQDASRTVDAVKMRFPGNVVVTAGVGEGDASEDWVVLDLDEPLPLELRPIPLGMTAAQPWDDCRCLGFPLTAAEYGFQPVMATVSGEIEREGVPVLSLEANVAGMGGLDVRGLSGGPVVPRRMPEEAVGVMCRRLLREGHQVGVLYACPISLFIDKPSLRQRQRQRTDEDAFSAETLAEAARQGDSGAAARLGSMFLNSGEKEKAEPWLRQAAAAGIPSSAYALGMLMDPRGDLADTDPERAKEALTLFRRAATGGDVYGATTMGIRLHQQGRSDAALPWLEEAVDRNSDAMAAHTLGCIYEQRGDTEEAERWQRFAAERGDVRAAFFLGRMLNDRGDREQALTWLRRATLDPGAVDLLRQLGEQVG